MNRSEQIEFSRAFNRFLRRKENELTPMMYKALQAQIRSFIDKGINYANIEFIDTLPVAEAIKKLYTSTGVLWAHQAYLSVRRQAGVKARAPIGFNEAIINQILEYFKLQLLNDTENITATTKAFIRRVLARNTVEGIVVDDIVDELMKADLTRVRARLITRTEIMKASNIAEQFGTDKTGLETQKIWISAHDHRTRLDHRTVDGQTVADGSPFTVGPEKFLMQRPGDSSSEDGRKVPAKEICNCRCTIGRKVIRGANGVPLKKYLTERPVRTVVPGIAIKLW